MEKLIDIAYIVASILFIFGIKMLGKAETARKGNLLSSVGMLLAVVATLFYKEVVDYKLIFGGLAVGGVIGFVWAKRVQMTGMPELVALFNGFGGLASLLVGWAEFGKKTDAVTQISIYAAILIGGVTFTGSFIAYLKLAGKMSGRPTLFAGQKAINAVLFLVLVVLGVIYAVQGPAWALYAIIVLSLALGILGVLPIGGGDMPVVIAFLNSFSGLAGAAAGFVILNKVLIVAGCLVGTSGIILTIIMCKAMNRTFGNVLFGGFGAAGGPAGKAVEGEMKGISVEDAYYVLEAAQNVVFVPGYGMAVAQAQHAVK
ncbi:MAG: NAD(P)(+) transhydrogenase (Re/Si-specific) subunit beta, partial [Verrucomicrobiae bacterium]|nr:NAD(P)(+) transhydrogenase (Re/Si-specific) subunit beta [Verrucomicrobiae bacterium]